jgi:protein TonB
MKITATFSTLLIASAIAIAGCGTPPATDVNAAKAPVDETASSSAGKPVVSRQAAKKKASANVHRATPTAPSNAASTARARTAEMVTPPTKIKNVQPVYPAIARAANVEGSVVLVVDIDAGGKVSDARVVRSVPLLDQAALNAVKQWEYSPMRRGDVAVPTTMTVTVNFVRT